MTTTALAPRRSRQRTHTQPYCQFNGCRNVDELIPYRRSDGTRFWSVCPACYRLITAERLRAIGMYRGGPNTYDEQATAAHGLMCFAAMGVRPNCTERDLKEAWRNIAKANHPDHGGDHNMYIVLQDAYHEARRLRGFKREGAAR